MGTRSNTERSRQLGVPFGTANSRLKKLIIFSLIVKLGENQCYQCGQIIETADELSIEHKKPWLHTDKALFWDIDNIAFSHLRCNRPNRPAQSEIRLRRRKDKPGLLRCRLCREFKEENQFSKHKGTFDGLDYECKGCRSASRKKSRGEQAVSKPLKSCPMCGSIDNPKVPHRTWCRKCYNEKQRLVMQRRRGTKAGKIETEECRER